MAELKLNRQFVRVFKMIDSADHFSKKTGLTCTVNLSKNGAAFGAAAGSVAEIGNGWYSVTLTSADTNTLGDLAYYITASGADDTDFVDRVTVNVLDDTMPVNVVQYVGGTTSTNIAGIPKVDTVDWNGTAVTTPDTAGSPKVTITAGSGAGQLDFTSGVVKSNLVQVDGTVNATHASGNVPADIRNIIGNVVNTSQAQLGVNIVSYSGGTTSTNVAGIPKVDVVDWVGGTVPAVNVTGVPLVDLKYTLGTISPATAGSVRADQVTTAVFVQGGTTGSVTGSVGSVTGAVGSVTGNVGGNVVGSVNNVVVPVFVQGGTTGRVTVSTALVTGDVQGNVVGSVGSVTGAVGSVSGNVSGSVNSVVTPVFVQGGTTGSVTGSVGSVTGSVGSVTGAVGSVTGSVGSVVTPVFVQGGTTGSVTGSVGSVTGSVGSVSGAVGSVTGNVGGNVAGSVNSVTTAVTVGTNNDKTGYSLASGQLFVKKNSALANFMFLMLDSTDHVTPKTGLTITSQVSIDGGAFAGTANSASEIGSGVYVINLAAADMNGTTIMLKFSSAGADTRYIEIVTQT